MIKKAITYENADGIEVTRDFYFHITQAEMMELMLIDPENDPHSRLQRVVDSNDKQAIMAEFKRFIQDSVGRRLDNGDFIKTPEYAQSFMSSEPYSQLFQELMTNTESVTEFINGLFPKKLRQQAAEAARQRKETVVELPGSGIIEGVVGDAAVQAEKPQPQFAATPFPQTTEAAIKDNIKRQGAVLHSVDESDDPAWLREGRQPTRQEMIKMSKEELQFVFKMKEAGLLS